MSEQHCFDSMCTLGGSGNHPNHFDRRDGQTWPNYGYEAPPLDRTGWETAEKLEAALLFNYGVRSDFPWPLVNFLIEEAKFAERLRAGIQALADEREANGSECGSYETYKEEPEAYAFPHYPAEGWGWCDGCAAAESADHAVKAFADALRGLLSTPEEPT